MNKKNSFLKRKNDETDSKPVARKRKKQPNKNKKKPPKQKTLLSFFKRKAQNRRVPITIKCTPYPSSYDTFT